MQWFSTIFFSQIKHQIFREVRISCATFSIRCSFQYRHQKYGRILDYFGKLRSLYRQEIQIWKKSKNWILSMTNKSNKNIVNIWWGKLYNCSTVQIFRISLIHGSLHFSIRLTLCCGLNIPSSFPLIWGSSFKNVIALPHWQLKISQHSILMKSYVLSSFIHFLKETRMAFSPWPRANNDFFQYHEVIKQIKKQGKNYKRVPNRKRKKNQ